MNRFLLAALVTVSLAACGSKQATTEQAVASPPPAAAAPAAPEAAPAPAAATASADAKAIAALTNDGETVDDSPSAAVSPIVAAVAANTPAAAAATASRWRAGEHYTLLPVAQPVSVGPDEIEVTEIFWYGCGHCFTLEPRVAAWDAEGRPDFVRLVRLPVVWNEVTREDARLFYTLQALGKLDQLHMAVFRELHVNRNPLTVIAGNRVDQAATENKVREFLATHGVSAEQFGAAYRSFATESKIRQAENLSRRYMADHTPMVVVQGKYTTDVTMAGGVDRLFELINDVAAREHSGR